MALNLLLAVLAFPIPDNPDNVVGTAICAVNMDGSNLRILADRGAHNSRQPDW